MATWQEKLAALCDALGPAGEAVYTEIADAVLAEIDAAYERGQNEHECPL